MTTAYHTYVRDGELRLRETYEVCHHETDDEKLTRLVRLGTTRRLIEREYIGLYREIYGEAPVSALAVDEGAA